MPKKYPCVCNTKFDGEPGLHRHQNACKPYRRRQAQRKRDRLEADLDVKSLERDRQLVENERRRLREEAAAIRQLMRTKNTSHLTNRTAQQAGHRTIYTIPDVDEDRGQPRASQSTETTASARPRSPSPQAQGVQQKPIEGFSESGVSHLILMQM